MKTLYYVLGSILAFLALRKVLAKRGVTLTGPTATQIAIAAVGNAEFPGGAGDPSKIVLADQNAYPGFYVTETGGYINPSNGQWYSPGSAPASYALTAAQQATVDAEGQSIADAFGQHRADAINAARATEYVPGENLVY